jgi:hypothetical protein
MSVKAGQAQGGSGLRSGESSVEAPGREDARPWSGTDVDHRKVVALAHRQISAGKEPLEYLELSAVTVRQVNDAWAPSSNSS